MKVCFELSDDQLDAMAIFALKEAYRFNAGYNTIDNSDEKIDPDYDFLKSVDHVLQYFLNYEQTKIWNREKAFIHEQEGTTPPVLEV